jgi:hypothetical protein
MYPYLWQFAHWAISLLCLGVSNFYFALGKLRGFSPRANNTERPPLVGEVNVNFYGWRVPRGQRGRSLRPYSGYSRQEVLYFPPSSSSVVLTRLSGPRSRPTTSQKIWQHRESNQDFSICSQELWPLDYRIGLFTVVYILHWIRGRLKFYKKHGKWLLSTVLFNIPDIYYRVS